MPARTDMSATRCAGAQPAYRMPAEWEKHAATWMGWPHHPTDWPGKLDTVRWMYAEIAKKITQGEEFRLLIDHERHEAQARKMLGAAGVDLSRVRFFRFPTNRGWTRDYGPVMVRTNDRAAKPAILNLHFNGWAKYKDYPLDASVAPKAAKSLKLPLVDVKRPDNKPFVLEGGAIDVNGEGTLLTTEECLLDPKTQVRNPGLSREAVEGVLREHLGATNVVWLGNGIAGDDTHGHVDDLCRFVNKTTLVLAQEKNPKDANYKALNENRERLQSVRLENGKKPEVAYLPMPSPVCFRGMRLPASYANFYIANHAVLVPTFNDANDRVALGILGDLFTNRPVIGIHAADLVVGLGTLHCLTQQALS